MTEFDVNTRDIGFAIRDMIEDRTFSAFTDQKDGEVEEHENAFRVETVDISDPNNLVVMTDGGKVFDVRIFRRA